MDSFNRTQDNHNFLKIAFLGILILLGDVAISQCSLSSYATGSVLTPNCSASSINVGSGAYVRFNVVNGATYEFYTCGSNFDTQLSGYTSGGSFRFYNDDSNTSSTCTNCTVPQTCNAYNGSSNLHSYVRWTSNFTGQLRVMVNKYNCQGYTGSGSSQSAILRYRVIDSSTATWTGVINDRWSNRRNWQPPCLPTTSDNVSIPNTSRKPRLINSETGNAKTVTMSTSSGARLNLQNSSKLNVAQ